MRSPVRGDGALLWKLAQQEPGIDLNSEYCYHLLQLHNADSCVLAWSGDQPIGFIAGTRPVGFDYGPEWEMPADAPGQTLFIWQVAVHPYFRGQGLARRMLDDILARRSCRNILYIQGTVIPGNTASEGFFRSIARDLECPVAHGPLLPAEMQVQDERPEYLFHIGPISTNHPANEESSV